MRNISFALTTEQVRRQEKTVTRRVGWLNLKVGALLQPIVKGQGLKKGERPEKIGAPIHVVSVRREPLWNITLDDCCREGFPMMTPPEFCNFFTDSHRYPDHADATGKIVYRRMHPKDVITRIEFEYGAGKAERT